MSKIQTYINDRDKYKVDPTYQRPSGAWSNEDNQCFVDTILRGEPIPIFFLNYDSQKELYYIVDGQQRLHCISEFYDNRIKLSGEFSGKNNHGKTFNGENPLNGEQKRQFLDYDLKFHVMENDDERVRLIFARLQRGKPLQLGERLNAKPGSIVQCMRTIADHPFMKDSIAVAKNRYGVYPDAARILFYEKYKARQCGTNELFNFFDENRDLHQFSSEYKSATNVLNSLEKCFPAKDGPYHCFEKHAWVLAVYSMVRELKVGYSLVGHEERISTFIREFHGKVYNEDFRRSKRVCVKVSRGFVALARRRFKTTAKRGENTLKRVARGQPIRFIGFSPTLDAEFYSAAGRIRKTLTHTRSKPDYQRFYDNIRGGWAERIIALRRDTLIKEFLNKHQILALDDKRQISEEDKIALFAAHSSCEMCECKLKDWREAGYHHRELYSRGGRTEKENIMVLCANCHDLVHGRRRIEVPAEAEEESTEEDE